MDSILLIPVIICLVAASEGIELIASHTIYVTRPAKIGHVG